MQRYMMRRLVLAVPTLFGITVLIFIAMRILPGDPLSVIATEGGGQYTLTDDELEAARASLGLDRPLYQQYGSWIADVLRGDLGYSFWGDTPIRETVIRRGAISMEIAVLAVLVSWLVGVPLGILSATHRNSWVDHALRVLMTLLMAIPSFWIGLTVIMLLVTNFAWRPPLTIAQLWDDPVHNLQMVIGPALALGIGLAAGLARLTRSSVLESLHEDYVRTARSKGLADRIIVFRHVLRNAMLPIVTATGAAIGGLLGGAVATETAFGVPGLGSLLVQALVTRDWMVIQNLVLIYAVIFVLVNLAVDLSYGWIDPRIRYQ
ncbi:MAG TPA: ABC transporter permease [Thermomicrobiales bacterium]|nr:ABC transporter permease [Thermomicrobiales bacterium]